LIKDDSKDMLQISIISISNKYNKKKTKNIYSSKNPEKKEKRFPKNIKQQNFH